MGAFVLAVLALIFAAMGTAPAWWQIAAVPVTVVLGILSFALLRYRDRITDAGAPARDHLRGLREYLQLAEADRLRVLQSPEGAERRPIDPDDPRQVLHLYERLLPWAIVWGVEKEWSEALDTRVRESGDDLHWYRGGGGFSSAALLSTMGTLRTASARSRHHDERLGELLGRVVRRRLLGRGLGRRRRRRALRRAHSATRTTSAMTRGSASTRKCPPPASSTFRAPASSLPSGMCGSNGP